MDEFRIDPADPLDPVVLPLVRAHLEHSVDIAPQTSNHTLAPEQLSGPGIRLWSISGSEGVLGCGGLKQLPTGEAEVKSVHVAATARGRGLARALMLHLISIARDEAIGALVLETGSMEDYAPARRLYEALGFEYCGPIFGYEPDPNSVFMRLTLG